MVRSIEEIRARGIDVRSLDSEPFNSFINDNILTDLPLHGRNYTWFKGDDNSMSRFVHFLLFEDWCLRWPNCLQMAALQELSNHCPVDEENWGMRPTRMLKCWSDISGYHKFVREKWQSFQVQGWGGFVLREKLKLIKMALKEWHLSHTHTSLCRINSLKESISLLESKGEVEVLIEEEVNGLHGLSVDLHTLSKTNASISWQQSRLSWLREGDANSKYFHAIMSSRWRSNAISFILVERARVEGVFNVWETLFKHFENHFKSIDSHRSEVENLQFCTLSYVEGATLTKLFCLDKVKATV